MKVEILEVRNNLNLLQELYKINVNHETAIITNQISQKILISGFLNKNNTTEFEISKIYDLIEVLKKPSKHNIFTLLQNKNIKPELKPKTNTVFNPQDNPLLQQVLNKTLATPEDLTEISKLWFDNPDIKLQKSEIESIIKNKNEFIKKIHANETSIYLTSEIPNKNFQTVIIANVNEFYNSVLHYILNPDKAIDIKNVEKNHNFTLASKILQAKELYLFTNNANNTNFHMIEYYRNKCHIINNKLKDPQAQNHINHEAYSTTNNTKITVNKIAKFISNPFYFYLEYILALKKTPECKIKITDYDIKNNILQANWHNNTHLETIDRYKIKKHTLLYQKTLKYHNITGKLSTESQFYNFNIHGAEVSIKSDFEIDKVQFFHTTESKTKITNNLDIKAAIISNLIPQSMFINYKDTQITAKNGNNDDSVKEVIKFYKTNQIYKNTKINKLFTKEYQHLARNILIS